VSEMSTSSVPRSWPTLVAYLFHTMSANILANSSIKEHILRRPVLGVHGAVLRVRHAVNALHVRVGEAALTAANIARTSFLALGNAAVDVEAAIGPGRHAHVSVLAVAVNGRLNGSAVRVGLDGVVAGDGGELVVLKYV
jgi:hypothetical protein